MRFEWDEAKRLANIEKHGIDFVRATSAFDGRVALTIPSRRFGELRFLTVARIDGKLVSVVWTPRGQGSTRLISARRASSAEERQYRQLLV
jgi:uncharacterized DUF497 family protein